MRIIVEIIKRREGPSGSNMVKVSAHLWVGAKGTHRLGYGQGSTFSWMGAALIASPVCLLIEKWKRLACLSESGGLIQLLKWGKKEKVSPNAGTFLKEGKQKEVRYTCLNSLNLCLRCLRFYSEWTCALLLLCDSRVLSPQRQNPCHFSHCNPQLPGCSIKADQADLHERELRDPPQTLAALTNMEHRFYWAPVGSRRGKHKISQQWD